MRNIISTVRVSFVWFLLFSIVCVTNTLTAAAQEPSQAGDQTTGDQTTGDQTPTQSGSGTVLDESKPIGFKNWKTRTLGGQQFWTDVRFTGGWRVQHNTMTKHYRLIDSGDVRHAWGNRLHCDMTLDKLVADGTVKLYRGKIVIVLHGLMRTSNAMEPMARYLRERGGFTTLNFQYASTRNTVGDHAAALKSVVDQLGPHVTEINFLGHSLGNIVVRRYLYDTTDRATGKQGDPRIKRMVMLGPPNQGSRIAELLKGSFLFNTIAGVSGAQLSSGWKKLSRTLATPNFEFGIIAGGQSDGDITNFALKGKDDFTVSVEEAKLPGARDLLVRPLLHGTMMHQRESLVAALSFFQNGYFVSETARTPIPVAIQGSIQNATQPTRGSRQQQRSRR
ncbi:MAG: esterase/lipase family protein [Mariniblastus sp.]